MTANGWNESLMVQSAENEINVWKSDIKMYITHNAMTLQHIYVLEKRFLWQNNKHHLFSWIQK